MCDCGHTYTGGASHSASTQAFSPYEKHRSRTRGVLLLDPYAPTVAESRSRIAAATRSAMRLPVKPTSSCSSAGLPCVT